MLYVFYVDVGKRLSFDMNLVNESVQHLKHVIEEHCRIPASKQVLLISGGDCLDDTAKVCNYSAGTDTNPIYLFNRIFLERHEMPSISIDYRYSSVLDSELNQIYDSIVNTTAPPTIYTINKINQLAQKYLEQALETKSYCDQLNNDQLLQQQGLAAAIANLDDVLCNFKYQCETFDSSYTRYLETRQENIDLINRCSEEDLKLLSNIPLLPALLDGNEEERARVEMCCDNSKLSDLTLLHWISAKDPEQSLENVVESCKTALIKYDDHALLSLKEDISTLFHPDRLRMLHNNSNNSDVSEKLMTLSGLIVTIKDTYEDQAKKASGIKRNHDRATELKEDCVLPDLLETHRDTIRTMKANHTNLRSCRQLCTQAKKELCDIIHNRLKDIMNIQEQAAEIQTMLRLHGDYLKRIRAYIEIIHQLHTTPRNYMAAVSEVVRRRSYSQAFLMWASDLACRIFTIYTEETERRKKFLSQFEGHFLTCLFPGLEDMPPAFATQSPPLFDNNLPALCEDDLNLLCQNLPDLKACIELPDVDAVRNFFLSKSLTLSEDEYQDEDAEKTGRSSVNDKLAVVMTAAGISDHSSSFTKSEPPTQDMITSSDSNYCTQDSSSMNDSSKQIEKISHEKDMQLMRDSIAVLGTVAHTAVISLRNDLLALKTYMFSHRSEFECTLQHLYAQIRHQQSQIQDLSQTVKSRDDTIKSLLTKISEMEIEELENGNGNAKYEKIEKQVREDMEKEREKAIKEVTEHLNHSHKQEIEALRQRFKLMACTNMERCPSETSLEKVERNDVIDLANHEVVIAQLKLNMEIETSEILEKEKMIFKKELEELTEKFEQDKLAMQGEFSVVRDAIVEDYKKQLEAMKLRENSLLRELQRHKDTIHTLTAPEGSSNSLLTRIENLETEKRNLQSELIKERQMKYSCVPIMQSQTESMISECGGSSTSLSNSSPELPQNKNRFKERIAYKKSRGSTFMPPNKICLQTCNVGDPVLVVWDTTQRNYTILQDSNTLHFLHPTSLEQLGLQPVADGSPRKLYCPVEVIEKEFCTPKKMNNRYNLKEGERFYRVKVKPLTAVIRTA